MVRRGGAPARPAHRLPRAGVDADARAVRALFESRYGTVPTSFVFPRNQVGHLDVLARHGVTTVRENPTPWFWSATAASEQRVLTRGMRLADALVPLGRRAFDVRKRVHRASHFVRFALPDASEAVRDLDALAR